MFNDNCRFMKIRFLIVLALIAAIPALLCACASPSHSQDELVGNWSQKVGANELTWQFKPDGTLDVLARNGKIANTGVYRRLAGNRVALDFGPNLNSIVNLAILGNQLLITNPKGEVTTLMRVNPETVPSPAPTPTPKPQPAPPLTNQPAPAAKPAPEPTPRPATNAPPKTGPNPGQGPL